MLELPQAMPTLFNIRRGSWNSPWILGCACSTSGQGQTQPMFNLLAWSMQADHASKQYNATRPCSYTMQEHHPCHHQAIRKRAQCPNLPQTSDPASLAQASLATILQTRPHNPSLFSHTAGSHLGCVGMAWGAVSDARNTNTKHVCL